MHNDKTQIILYYIQKLKKNPREESPQNKFPAIMYNRF